MIYFTPEVENGGERKSLQERGHGTENEENRGRHVTLKNPQNG